MRQLPGSQKPLGPWPAACGLMVPGPWQLPYWDLCDFSMGMSSRYITCYRKVGRYRHRTQLRQTNDTTGALLVKHYEFGTKRLLCLARLYLTHHCLHKLLSMKVSKWGWESVACLLSVIDWGLINLWLVGIGREALVIQMVEMLKKEIPFIT